MTFSLHHRLILLAQTVVSSLPGPLHQALDAWSLRLARGRALERQRKWQRQKEQQARAAAAAGAATRSG